jgi:hypothetical protein
MNIKNTRKLYMRNRSGESAVKFTMKYFTSLLIALFLISCSENGQEKDSVLHSTQWEEQSGYTHITEYNKILSSSKKWVYENKATDKVRLYKYKIENNLTGYTANIKVHAHNRKLLSGGLLILDFNKNGEVINVLRGW